MESPQKQSVFALLQKIGQCLMIPVSVLPAAGLLVAIGRMVQRASESADGAVTQPLVHALGQLCYSGGLAIFEQLSLVFAIGVAIGFTGGAGVAGLASAVGYFTLINVLTVIGKARELALPIQTGVFGGIVIGLVTAAMYKRYSQTKLHPIFGFFSGKRLVPIVTAGAAIGVGVVLGFVWPPVQQMINDFGHYVMGSPFGPAFYAAGKRLLIPVGLHHVYYPPFLYEFGEYATQAGQVLKGETARYFGGDPTAGRFMAAEFPIMLFGLPAAALAITMRAEPARRKAIAGVMLSAALTSIITGITEPIEFTFIFVAPLLYVFHVLGAFLSGFLTGYFDVHLGYTFSASLIDFVLGYFNQKNSLWLFAVIGPVIGLLYFGTFYWLIEALKIKTPGRDVEETDSITRSSDSVGSRTLQILEALGGSKNILSLDACITRLRLQVKDAALVNVNQLKSLGAAGVLNAGQGNFQVVFGVESDMIKEDLRTVIENGPTAVTDRVVPVVQASTALKPMTRSQIREILIGAPVTGRMMSLEEVPDETFAQKIIGEGFAIDPTEGVVRAPFDGKVVQVFRTGHAIGIVSNEGVEVLIHIGIDTVKMNGEGFKPLVSQGEEVRAGDALIEFDLELVRKNAKSTITPVVVTNVGDYKGFKVSTQSTIQNQQNAMSVTIS